MAVFSANKRELLQIADSVAREKSIDRSIVLSAMEEAIAKAFRTRYGHDTQIVVKIEPKTGETTFARSVTVVEDVTNPFQEIELSEARKIDAEAEIGGSVLDPLPPFDFGRVAAQSAKQVIIEKVREAERACQYEEYRDRIGEIINGQVKRVDFGNIYLDLSRGEAVIRQQDLLPREVFRPGDRVRAYLVDVRKDARSSQIILSRTHPDFMAKLFRQEVPEIYDGIVEIRAVARDPGSRAKIAVVSNDSSIDPIGACVGMRGSRVQAIVNELQGEKIDIIPWSVDQATFVVNALQPAEVIKVIIDEELNKLEVVVPDDQLSYAIGRRGQNVRLASQLTGVNISILTEQTESERRQKDFSNSTDLFMEVMGLDETASQLLASEGFRTIEDVAYASVEELTAIHGVDVEQAERFITLAKEGLSRKESEMLQKLRELNVAEALKGVEGLTLPMLLALAEQKILTLDDLAACSTDELVGYITRSKDQEKIKHPGLLDRFDVSRVEAEAMILSARVQAGWIPAEDGDSSST